MGLNAFQLSLCITLLDTAPTKEEDLAQAAWHAATNDFRLFGMPSESQLLAAKHYCCNEMAISAIKRTCAQLFYPPPGIVGKANRKIWIYDAIKKQKTKTELTLLLALHPIIVDKANGRICLLRRCRSRGNIPLLG